MYSEDCKAQLKVELPRRPVNGLNVEIGATGITRCALKSPDGRGLIWLYSGGEATSYGFCNRHSCPLETTHNKNQETKSERDL